MTRKKISEETLVSVSLTLRDRDLIVNYTMVDAQRFSVLRVDQGSENLIAPMTLYDIEDLIGFVAAEANHCDDQAVSRELSDLARRLESEMMKYDDGNWQHPDTLESQ